MNELAIYCGRSTTATYRALLRIETRGVLVRDRRGQFCEPVVAPPAKKLRPTRRRQRGAVDEPGLLAMLAVVALVGIVALLWVVDCNKRNECREKGGAVVEYNCRPQTSCTTTPTSNGGSTTHCSTYEVCDWRCELPAEVHP